MKKSVLLFVLLMAVSFGMNAQNTESSSTAAPVTVSTHSGYMLSFGTFERNNQTLKNIARFTVVINLGFDVHWQSEKVAVSLGLETRNLGTIVEDTLNQFQNVRTKHRVYTVGAPVTLMFGNIKQRNYFFVSGEYEYTFDYKEKVFVEGDKQYKSKGEYTNNVNRWLPSLAAGFQLQSGTYVKFQYYMTDFFSDKYQFTYTKGTTQVYQPFNKSQLYFVELGHRAFLDKPAGPVSKTQQTRLNRAKLREQMAAM